jgi:hypothetical protein
VVAQASEPVRGGGEVLVAEPGGRRDRLVGVVARVRAEVADVRADAAQAHERLAHPRVGQVPGAVEEERVPAQALPGGARLDPGQVDAADGELGEDAEQRADPVVIDVDDQGRDVVPGRLGRRDGAHDVHEAGLGVRVVADVEGLHGKSDRFGGERGAHARVELAVGDALGGLRGREGLVDDGARQFAAQVAAGLGEGVRVGGDRGDRVERLAGGEHHRDREDHFAEDDERVAADELVDGDRDRALLRVLDRHEAGVDVAAADGVEDVDDRRQGGRGRALGGGQPPERGLGEGSARAEIGELHGPTLARPVPAGPASRASTRWRPGRDETGVSSRPRRGRTYRCHVCLSGPSGIPRW